MVFVMLTSERYTDFSARVRSMELNDVLAENANPPKPPPTCAFVLLVLRMSDVVLMVLTLDSKEPVGVYATVWICWKRIGENLDMKLHQRNVWIEGGTMTVLLPYKQRMI